MMVAIAVVALLSFLVRFWTWKVKDREVQCLELRMKARRKTFEGNLREEE